MSKKEQLIQNIEDTPKILNDILQELKNQNKAVPKSSNNNPKEHNTQSTNNQIKEERLAQQQLKTKQQEIRLQREASKFNDAQAKAEAKASQVKSKSEAKAIQMMDKELNAQARSDKQRQQVVDKEFSSAITTTQKLDKLHNIFDARNVPENERPEFVDHFNAILNNTLSQSTKNKQFGVLFDELEANYELADQNNKDEKQNNKEVKANNSFFNKIVKLFGKELGAGGKGIGGEGLVGSSILNTIGTGILATGAGILAQSNQSQNFQGQALDKAWLGASLGLSGDAITKIRTMSEKATGNANVFESVMSNIQEDMQSFRGAMSLPALNVLGINTDKFKQAGHLKRFEMLLNSMKGLDLNDPENIVKREFFDSIMQGAVNANIASKLGAGAMYAGGGREKSNGVGDAPTFVANTMLERYKQAGIDLDARSSSLGAVWTKEIGPLFLSLKNLLNVISAKLLGGLGYRQYTDQKGVQHLVKDENLSPELIRERKLEEFDVNKAFKGDVGALNRFNYAQGKTVRYNGIDFTKRDVERAKEVMEFSSLEMAVRLYVDGKELDVRNTEVEKAKVQVHGRGGT